MSDPRVYVFLWIAFLSILAGIAVYIGTRITDCYPRPQDGRKYWVLDDQDWNEDDVRTDEEGNELPHEPRKVTLDLVALVKSIERTAKQERKG